MEKQHASSHILYIIRALNIIDLSGLNFFDALRGYPHHYQSYSRVIQKSPSKATSVQVNEWSSLYYYRMTLGA